MDQKIRICVCDWGGIKIETGLLRCSKVSVVVYTKLDLIPGFILFSDLDLLKWSLLLSLL